MIKPEKKEKKKNVVSNSFLMHFKGYLEEYEQIESRSKVSVSISRPYSCSTLSDLKVSPQR